jgi:hypothetical protein
MEFFLVITFSPLDWKRSPIRQSTTVITFATQDMITTASATLGVATIHKESSAQRAECGNKGRKTAGARET